MTQHFFNVRLATKPIRRISHHSVHAVIRQLAHDIKAVALIERPVRHRASSREKAPPEGEALFCFVVCVQASAMTSEHAIISEARLQRGDDAVHPKYLRPYRRINDSSTHRRTSSSVTVTLQMWHSMVVGSNASAIRFNCARIARPVSSVNSWLMTQHLLRLGVPYMQEKGFIQPGSGPRKGHDF